MTKRLSPYGSGDAESVAKVGKSKTPRSLAARMPSAEVFAKVGKAKTPRTLAARMPSIEVAAKVGEVPFETGVSRRVVRRIGRA